MFDLTQSSCLLKYRSCVSLVPSIYSACSREHLTLERRYVVTRCIYRSTCAGWSMLLSLREVICSIHCLLLLELLALAWWRHSSCWISHLTTSLLNSFLHLHLGQLWHATSSVLAKLLLHMAIAWHSTMILNISCTILLRQWAWIRSCLPVRFARASWSKGSIWNMVSIVGWSTWLPIASTLTWITSRVLVHHSRCCRHIHCSRLTNLW